MTDDGAVPDPKQPTLETAPEDDKTVQRDDTTGDSPELGLTRRRTIGVLGAGLVAGPGLASASTAGTVSRTDADDDAPVDLDGYPYGYDETRIEEAKRVMEEGGYGPDDRYQLDWLQYNSPTWKEMAEVIQARLDAAYIDVEITSVGFNPLLNRTANGEHEAYTLGWIPDYPGPQNFVQLLAPDNTDYLDDPAADGARIFWSEDADTDQEVRQYAVDKFDELLNNPEPTDEARRKRAEAAIAIEEANWEEMGLLPVYHESQEYFWHDWVDFDVPGTMGRSRARTSDTVDLVEVSDRLPVTSSTITTLDPVASGDTASHDVVTDLYEGLTGYPNGQTNVDLRLAKRYEVSDDLTTYTFTLKEGVEFHDGTELTADDVVYSFRRLLESENSTNGRYVKSVLPLTYETEVVENDEGDEVVRVVPDSLGVTATGRYEVEIELEEPFTHTTSVLAYPAFAVVPEGIVGDIEGYDGEMSYREFSTANPVGTGPFEFVEWTEGAGGEITLDTFGNYHGNGPEYEGIDASIRISPDATYERFKQGDSATGYVPAGYYDPSKVDIDKTDDRGRRIGTYGPLENGDFVNYAMVPDPSTFYVGFNMEKVPRPVRKAMAYVVNQKQFAQEIFRGRKPPAYHLMPPQVYPGGADKYEDHYRNGGSGSQAPVEWADEDDDGQISTSELQRAIRKWATGDLDTEALRAIVRAWATSG